MKIDWSFPVAFAVVIVGIAVFKLLDNLEC